MKKYISFLLLPLLLPAFALAAFNDISVGDSGSATLSLTVGGSSATFTVSVTAEQINVGASSFTVNLATGGSSGFSVVSTDKYTYTVSPSTAVTSFTCGSTSSTLIVQRGSTQDAVNVTVTPSATTCTSSDNSGNLPSGGSGGSSGGGGGGSSAPASVPPVVVRATTIAHESAVAALVSPVFNSDLSVGSKRKDDIKLLQTLLAKDKSLYPQGIINGSFGKLTVSAVKRFQKKYGLPAIGTVGPKTRAKLQEIFGNLSTTPSINTTSPAPSSSQTQSLQDKINALLNQVKKARGY